MTTKMIKGLEHLTYEKTEISGTVKLIEEKTQENLINGYK